MTLIQMSISGAVLITAILLIRALTINRLPKQTFLILWGLVIVRLLVPFTIPSPLSIYSLILRNVPIEIPAELSSGILISEAPSDPVLETSDPVLATSVQTKADSLNHNTADLYKQAGSVLPDAGTALSGAPDTLAGSQKQSDTSAPNVPAQQTPDPAGNASTAPFTGSSALAAFLPAAPAVFMIRSLGTLLRAAFFVLSYLRCRLEFSTSLPVSNTYVNHWLECRHIRRRLSVRQSDRINTPLTYGILHPVILFPRQTDWTNTLELQYVLSHEYVHIRRLDAVTKLLAALVLCLHWFNPLVWVMYFLFNRDLELACDEKVIRHFGEASRSAYARMLIDMEAKKSGLLPLYNNFSKNAIEERITAIMKLKKISRPVMLFAAGLIIGVAVLFTTSAVYVSASDHTAGSSGRLNGAPNGTIYMPDTSFTEEEYAALLALRFEGYASLTVSEYQDKIWTITDTREYLDLLERFSQSTVLLDLRYADETASFLFNILEPLTAGSGKWRTRDFGGYTATSFPGTSDNASLEYNIFLTIKNPDSLTVGEYDASRQGMMTGLEQLLRDKTIDQLKEELYMQEAILEGIDSLKQKWGAGSLDIDVEYAYNPLNPDFTASDLTSAFAVESEPQREKAYEAYKEHDAYERYSSEAAKIETSERMDNPQAETDPRKNANATAEDYRSLFALMTPNHTDMPLTDFNSALLDWGNEHYDSYERIREDIFLDDIQADLSEEELAFAGLTMELSGEENYRLIQSLRTGRPQEDPVYRSYRLSKEKENGLIWCGFDYAFSYHISDPDKVTVGERDRPIGSAVQAVQEFWEGTGLEDLQKLTRKDVLRTLEEIAERYSDHAITITILEDRLYFEHMDERSYAPDQVDH